MDEFNYEDQEGLGHEVPNLTVGDRTPPYAQLPWAVIMDTQLSPMDMRVYAYMIARGGQKKATWVSLRTISDDLAISKTTASDTLGRLEARGLLRIGRVSGGKNTYQLPRVETVYGDATYMSWDERWKAKKKASVPVTRTEVFGSLEGRGSVQANPQVDKEQADKVLLESASDDASPPAEVVPFPSPSPAATRNLAMMGAFSGSAKEEPDPRDVRKSMYKEAKEKQKAERKAESDRKKAGAVSILNQKPEGVSQIEWDMQKGPSRLHSAFQNLTELHFRYSFVGKMTGKDIGQWKVLIQRLGSADKALTFVEFVVDNWEGFKERNSRFEIDRPSVSILVSGWYSEFLKWFQESGEVAGKATLLDKKTQDDQDYLDSMTIKD